MRLKMASAKWRPFCLGLNVLILPMINCCGIHLAGLDRYGFSIVYTGLVSLNCLYTVCSPQSNNSFHCGFVTQYGDRYRINISPSNGLLPDGNKSFPEPVLTNDQRSPVTITRRKYQKGYSSLHLSSLEITRLKFHWNLHGEKELIFVVSTPLAIVEHERTSWYKTIAHTWGHIRPNKYCRIINKSVNIADSRLALGQWKTLLQSSVVSHWLGANLESALRQ